MILDDRAAWLSWLCAKYGFDELDEWEESPVSIGEWVEMGRPEPAWPSPSPYWVTCVDCGKCWDVRVQQALCTKRCAECRKPRRVKVNQDWRARTSK